MSKKKNRGNNRGEKSPSGNQERSPTPPLEKPSKEKTFELDAQGDVPATSELGAQGDVLATSEESSVFSDTDDSSQRKRKSPFERYSAQSSWAIRQRHVSESAVPARRSILKQSSTESDDSIEGRQNACSFSHGAHQKRVSICEEKNIVRMFTPECGIDEQEARRKKNEKKRKQKAQKDEKK